MHIETSRTILRDWVKGDLDVYRHWGDGQHEWMKFDGPYFPRMTSQQLSEHLQKIEARIDARNWPALRRKVVIADKSTGSMLGHVSWYWECESTAWISMGIVIFDPRWWRQGIGKEAFQAWTTYLFQQDERLVRLGFQTWSGNHGMLGVGKSLGFQEEARFRKARIVDGEYFDSVGMGVLREEWNALHGPKQI